MKHYLEQSLYQLIGQNGGIVEFILNDACGGLLFWDLENTECLWMNDPLRVLLGCPRQANEDVSASFKEFVDFAALERLLAQMIAQGDTAGGAIEQLIPFQKKDNTQLIAQCRCCLFWDAGGKPIRLLGLLDDSSVASQFEQVSRDRIQELEDVNRSLQNELQESTSAVSSLKMKNVFLSAELEASIDGILVVDAEGNILYTNKRFVEMWEFPADIVETVADERAMRWVINSIADSDTFMAQVMDLYNNELETKRAEIALKNGKVFDQYTAPVLDSAANLHGRIWYFRDISSSKLMEDQLREAQRKAESANVAKSRFLSRMSHELRTPLNAIIGFSQIQEHYIDDETAPELKVSREHIFEAGNHLLALIEDILDIVKIEEDRLDLPSETVDIENAICESLVLVEVLASEKEVAVTRRETALTVVANTQRLKQVLINLLTNAVKFNVNGGGIELAVKQVEQGEVEVSVSDTGIGISPDEQAAIFEPFRRLDYANRNDIDGTGIGLALSKFLIEKMNGSIGVESEEGKGARFWIRLPEGGTLMNTDSGSESVETSKMPELTILYVEDNRASVQLLKMMLAPYSVVTLFSALSAEEGIELANKYLPDIILMDIALPGMDGNEACRLLRKDARFENTRIVAVSADAMATEIDMALASGFDSYLTKPLYSEQLIAEIKML